MSDTTHDPWGTEETPFTPPGAEATAEAEAYAASQTASGAGVPDAAGSRPAAGAAGAAQGSATCAAGAPPAGAWGAPYAGLPPVAVTGGGPSPAAAFWLGLIPGVGAMYNGQLAKGFVHLIVFMVLASIADHVDVFGFLVAGWIFFMAFEAYHTAKARRDGLPLPDPFGWNDVGERFGMGKGWPFNTAGATGSSPAPSAGPQTASTAAAGTYVPPTGRTAEPWGPAVPGPGTGPANDATSAPAPNWAGYVSPAAYAGSPAFAGSSADVPPGGVPPGHGMPYAEVHTGQPYGPASLPNEPVNSSRIPAGALWLIGLGVLFLLGQWVPLFRLGHVWIPALILGGLAVLWFGRRMGWLNTGRTRVPTDLPVAARVGISIVGPGVLLLVAVLNALNDARTVRWAHSWPWLFIAGGALLLIERAALRQAAALQTPADDAARKAGQ